MKQKILSTLVTAAIIVVFFVATYEILINPVLILEFFRP